MHEGLKKRDELIPLFILDPALFPACPEQKKNFLLEGLFMLDQELRQRGSRLIVRSGRPHDVLPALLAECGGGRIFAARDYTPYALKRDQLAAQAAPITFVKGNLRVEPPHLFNQNSQPYRVFTAFARAWRSHPVGNESLAPLPEKLPALPQAVASSPANMALPAIRPRKEFPSGEPAARERLRKFLSAPVISYRELRDRPDLEGVSCLSPYFHLGMLSAESAIRQAQAVALDASVPSIARAGAEAWIDELIWREFYIHILYHHPDLLKTSFRPEFRAIPWRQTPNELEAWKFGRTGCPMVDAGMRQMLATGWMHNRVRMIAASYLTKDLLIDWREGQRWFAANLIDYDPAANNGGWQWSAGTGADAAPYFRIFNPALQAKKFDPKGDYVRSWLPELASLPGETIHEPWKCPARTSSQFYPQPLVDHAIARQRTLAAYRFVLEKEKARR